MCMKCAVCIQVDRDARAFRSWAKYVVQCSQVNAQFKCLLKLCVWGGEEGGGCECVNRNCKAESKSCVDGHVVKQWALRRCGREGAIYLLGYRAVCNTLAYVKLGMRQMGTMDQTRASHKPSQFKGNGGKSLKLGSIELNSIELPVCCIFRHVLQRSE